MLSKIIDKFIHGFSFGLGMGISFIILPRNIETYQGKKYDVIEKKSFCNSDNTSIINAKTLMTFKE